MSGTAKPESSRPESPDVSGPLPELPDIDPVPEDGSPVAPHEPTPVGIPNVPPPGPQ